MIERLIHASLAHRGLVLTLAVLLAALSLISVRQLPLDAIPDLSDVQVIIRTPYAGQAPQIVEDQVTYPITTRMLAVPKAKAVRGFSMYGDSFVYVLFEDGTDLYWARSRVLEYLSQVRSDLPAGVEPQLGPDATGVGWVYQYALIDRTHQHDLAELRSLQDWRLRFELQRIPGVAEVASVGGFVRQYEAVVDPRRLQAYGIGFNQLIAAVRAANRETSGARLEMAESEYIVRGVGYIRSLDALGAVPTGVMKNGKAILLRDVAELRFGPVPRNGITELNGEGEAVGGIVVMRDGENAKAVIDAVKARLDSVRASLPPGVEIVPVYDRSSLIERAVSNLRGKLIEELLLVSLVCALFLWHVRSALVAVISLPLGVLIALAIMRWQGLNANIMSLGGIAIAIGAMVDAAVVMIENAHKHLEEWTKAHDGNPAEGTDHWRVIAASAVEVGPALFFSLLITALSFLPVFVLQAQEGRMFAPLAWTKTWALAVAAGLSVTLVPVLMGYWIRGRFADESEYRLTRWIVNAYRPVLAFALRRPKTIVLFAMLGLVSALWPITRIGSEFMPELEEGDVLYMPTTLPGLSPGEAQAVLQRTDRLIKSVPEVATVFGKAGRAETATDPAPLTMLETTVQFKPESEWRPGMTRDKVMAELQQKLALPGLTAAWVPPILNRINMQVSGIRTPLGVRVTGPDLATISKNAERIAAVLSKVPGTRSAFAERAADERQIDVTPDREMLARYGVSMEDAQEWLASAIGGEAISRAVEGRERYPIALRVPSSWRDSPESIAALPVVTPSGAQVPLGELARISLSDGPPMIRSEDAQLAAYVFVDLGDQDLAGYITRAEKALAEQAKLTPGVSWHWAGSYEHLQRAGERLRLAVPLTLVIVFGLLFAAFRRVAEASLIMLTVPFALVGGLWLLWLLGYAFSVAVAVGFIALAGVAAEFGVVMLIYLDAAVKRARSAGELTTVADLDAALSEGALRRVRPKVMTVVTILAGLLPILLASGAGAATMQRIAAPMLGGMLSAPLLSLIVIPAVYKLWLSRRLSATRGEMP
ncbi:MAG TPA: CusA/CzcA family heavy metal efflux RND transporter [Arenimonas sp.]|uniref:efflux RND transporter permease subunit n=1 Tax=Arenimonas sp. TaxID=1872635 RepID=UPI002C451D91|nr:CusA/CzcA family heavy metal efflux RND transporter [Arenimonas sp.]HMB57656.1 CusA/CzcA family heavy metal efflux RND transporter [Arenimonas sp.]